MSDEKKIISKEKPQKAVPEEGKTEIKKDETSPRQREISPEQFAAEPPAQKNLSSIMSAPKEKHFPVFAVVSVALVVSIILNIIALVTIIVNAETISVLRAQVSDQKEDINDLKEQLNDLDK